MISLRHGAVAVSLASIILFLSCSKGGDQPPRADSVDAAESRFIFLDDAAGIDFKHHLIRRGKYEIAEIIGTGFAVFDADGDEDLDVLCLDSGKLGVGAVNHLYLRGPDGRYTESAGGPGLEVANFSCGIAVGDIDNDGDLDVFIGNAGPDTLLVNDGSGQFSAASPEDSGIGDPGFATSAVFFDYDLDGWLDLYVCRYVVLEEGLQCSGNDGRDDYCHPAMYKPTSDLLYHNLGGGRFKDVSVETGIAELKSYGLGAVSHDFNGDGYPDIYAANDSRPNFLWINRGGKFFKDEALSQGVAVNGQGMPEASMGLAVGDFDGNGLMDIFVTHLRAESNTLYSCGPHGFDDRSSRAQLSLPSMAYTGFGTAFFDMDNDLDLDLAVANGSVGRHERPMMGARLGSPWEHYAEPNHLFENEGGRFRDASAAAGLFATQVELSRPLAAVDLDQDGAMDLVVGNTDSSLRIFQNRGPVGNFIKIRAYDDKLKRDVLGAVIRVQVGSRTLMARVAFDGSYATAVAEAQHFGLAEATEVDEVEITWPGGQKQKFGRLEANRSYTLKRAPR